MLTTWHPGESNRCFLKINQSEAEHKASVWKPTWDISKSDLTIEQPRFKIWCFRCIRVETSSSKIFCSKFFESIDMYMNDCITTAAIIHNTTIAENRWSLYLSIFSLSEFQIQNLLSKLKAKRRAVTFPEGVSGTSATFGGKFNFKLFYPEG